MVDARAAVTAAQMVASVVNTVKAARDLAKDTSNHELKEKIGDVFDGLNDLRQRILDLDEENHALKDKVADLEEQLRFKGKVYRFAGHTFVEGDDEEICSRCAEVDFKSVHLLDMDLGRGKYATCPECKTARAGFGWPKKRSQLREA